MPSLRYSFVFTIICVHLLQCQSTFGAQIVNDSTQQSSANSTPQETELQQPQFDGDQIPSNSTVDSTSPPTAQLPKPPSSTGMNGNENLGTTPTPAAGGAEQQVKEASKDGLKKAPIVARQSPPSSADPLQQQPFAPLKPESKDEMFARIDADGDLAINLQDYMNRDRYYVESVRTEFNDIDTNRDGKVTKGEFDAFVQRLDEQRKTAMLSASNFTLQKNDGNKDGELSVDELGVYINGTLQRSVAQLPEVFRQFDKDANQRLNLDEFHELDFNFPWEKFPPSNEPTMPSSNRQVFFNANAPVAPPFMNEQAAAAIAPQGAAQIPAPNVGYGSSGPNRPPSMPIPMPQPVRFFRWAQ